MAKPKSKPTPKSKSTPESAPEGELDLTTILADALCRDVAADVQKRAKANWKEHAPPALAELVKSKLKALKRLDWEVLEQLEALDEAVTKAKVDFDVTRFARAVYERSKASSSPPLGAAFLVARDVDIARERLLTCVNDETKTLAIDFQVDTLTDALLDALADVRKQRPFENLDLVVGNLTSHRAADLVKGVKKLDLNVGDATTSLPDGLFGPELIWLTLRGKKLTSIPDAIGLAANVVLLEIDALKVKALPKTLHALPLLTLHITVTLPAIDVSVWAPTMKNLYLNGSIKKITGLDKLPMLEDYTQRCGAKVPDEIWNVSTLERVWIFFDGFDDFDDVKAKFEARGVRFAQT